MKEQRPEENREDSLFQAARTDSLQRERHTHTTHSHRTGGGWDEMMDSWNQPLTAHIVATL